MNLEEVYSEKYCKQLEAAYGPGMMSEGGTAAIEHLFDTVDMQGKQTLDIGSGLGGVAFFVADRYHASVIGLEINTWMVAEAKRRTPEHLVDKVDFVRATDGPWPFADGIFDVIFSKGVLTHVEDKTNIMNECYRTLKPGGLLVISDALSSETRKWGEQITRLNEMESLNMYPESKSGYIKLLEKHHFILQSVRDDDKPCQLWTQQIIDRLKNSELRGEHLHYFDSHELDAHIEGYEAMLTALKTGELRSVRFIAQKGE